MICSTTPSRWTSSAKSMNVVEVVVAPHPEHVLPVVRDRPLALALEAAALHGAPVVVGAPGDARARSASRTRRPAGRSSRRATSRRCRSGSASTSSRVSQVVDGRAGPGLGVDPGGQALQAQRLAGAGLVEHQAGDAAGGELRPVAGGVHVLLGRVQPVDQHDHRRGAVVGGRGRAEVGRQRRALVGDRDPADPRVRAGRRPSAPARAPAGRWGPGSGRSATASARPGTGSWWRGSRAARRCGCARPSRPPRPGRRAGRSARVQARRKSGVPASSPWAAASLIGRQARSTSSIRPPLLSVATTPRFQT